MFPKDFRLDSEIIRLGLVAGEDYVAVEHSGMPSIHVSLADKFFTGNAPDILWFHSSFIHAMTCKHCEHTKENSPSNFRHWGYETMKGSQFVTLDIERGRNWTWQLENLRADVNSYLSRKVSVHETIRSIQRPIWY